jgi:D-inositol-3-phosphate glycosyltransferase
MTSPGLRRLRHWCSVLVATVALAVDDPAWFVVGACSKLPAPLRRFLGNTAVAVGGVTVIAAWGYLLLGESSTARAVLPADRSGSLAGALALTAGASPTGRLPRNRARWSWITGDLEAARSAAPDLSRRQRARLLGDLALLEPGPRPLPPVTRTWSVGEQPRVVHVLNNSLPWTRSGYTMRTHDVLTAQAAAG